MDMISNYNMSNFRLTWSTNVISVMNLMIIAMSFIIQINWVWVIYVWGGLSLYPKYIKCKTRAFPLAVLPLVWSWPKSSCLPGLFCCVFMYDMHVWATILFSFNARNRPVGFYAAPTLIFWFLFESNLIKFRTMSFASLDPLLHVWNPSWLILGTPGSGMVPEVIQ